MSAALARERAAVGNRARRLARRSRARSLEGFSVDLDPGHVVGAVVGAVGGALATGGVSLGIDEGSALLGYFASTGSTSAQDWLANASDEVRQVLSDIGITGYSLPLVAFTEALRGNVSAQDLWNALGTDVQAVLNKGKVLEDYESGNYTSAWNYVTDEGHGLLNLQIPTNGAPPPPRPVRAPYVPGGLGLGYDGVSVLARVMSGALDARDGADDLYAHGWYPEGDQARQAWLDGLVSTPLGSVVASTAAIDKGNRIDMAKLADALDAASFDPTVQLEWLSHGWGAPVVTLGPVASGLRQHAAFPPPPGLSVTWLTSPATSPLLVGGRAPAPTPAPTPTSSGRSPLLVGGVVLVAGLGGLYLLKLALRKRSNPRRRRRKAARR